MDFPSLMISVTRAIIRHILPLLAFSLSSVFAFAVTNNENSNSPLESHVDFLACAANGNLGEMKELIASGEDFNINYRDDEGWTALDWAILNEHVAVVQFLLEQPEIDLLEENNWRLKPEELARFCFRLRGTHNLEVIVELFQLRPLRGQGTWLPYYNERPAPSTDGSQMLAGLKALLSLPLRSLL